MPQYMMVVKGDETFKAGPPPKELFDAIMQFGIEATKDGSLVSQGGLQPTAKGARVRLDGGKLTVTDGPFTEAKEVIGGFAIIKAASKQAAIDHARKFMELHRKHWPAWDGETELREMYVEGAGPDLG